MATGLFRPSLFCFFVCQLTSFEGKRVDDLVINVKYFVSYLRVKYGSIEARQYRRELSGAKNSRQHNFLTQGKGGRDK